MLKYFIKTPLLLFTLIVFTQANATTVLYQNFNQLVDGSDHVVSGTVTDKQYQAAGDDVYTVITLTSASIIEQTGQRTIDQPILLRHYGGETISPDGKSIEGLSMSGTPELSVGQTVLLFVKDNGISHMPFSGWGQGVFVIHEDKSISNIEKNAVVSMQGANILFSSDIKNMYGQKTYGQEAFVNSVAKTQSMPDSAAPASAEPAAMSAANFISMIQERKSVTAAAAGVRTAEASSTDSLFILPAVTSQPENLALEPINAVVAPAQPANVTESEADRM